MSLKPEMEFQSMIQGLQIHIDNISDNQKQPTSIVLRKRCSENMQQIFRRTLMPKCDFSKVASNFIEIALRHWCSPTNLQIYRRTLMPTEVWFQRCPNNTSGWLLLSRFRALYKSECGWITTTHWILYFVIFHLTETDTIKKSTTELVYF